MKRFFALLALAAALAAQGCDWSREAARSAPAWVRSAVIYEVFPRDFSPQGNFEGVRAQLDRLKKLGVTALWIMPVHPIGREKRKGTLGSPYAVRDYYAIDESCGTHADLKRLVAAAHERGLKVILDVVLNHTAWDCVLMKRPGFYKHDKAGRIVPPVPEWSDVAGLDYSNPGLRRYMREMLAWWVRQFDLDGFRCDVAFGPPTDFWEQARAELDKIKPDLLMLAEASKPDLLVKAFDADYAWAFHSALTDVFENGKPAGALREAWERERAKFPRGALHMRFSDNHDERRAITRFGERGALAASALVFASDGVPLLYNGMEAGDTTESGAPALFERLPINWGFVERRPEFPVFYEALTALRRAHPALQTGETVWVENSDRERVVTFLRRGGGEEFLVAINASNRPFRGQVTLPGASGFSEVALPPVKPGGAVLPSVELDGFGWRFYRRPAP
jgi:cyclomaltodextrinase